MKTNQTPWLACLLVISVAPVKHIFAEPDTPRYVATGKLAVQMSQDRDGKEAPPDLRREFFATQFEILTSDELRRRALERVRGLHPELKEWPAQVGASQPEEGQHVIVVTASAGDPVYAMKYLDALLDEYMAFRASQVERSIGTAINKVIEEVLSRERAVKVKKSALDIFLRTNKLDSAEKRVQYAILEDDFKRTQDDYKVWSQVLTSLNDSLKKDAEDAGIIERPASAEKVR